MTTAQVQTRADLTARRQQIVDRMTTIRNQVVDGGGISNTPLVADVAAEVEELAVERGLIDMRLQRIDDAAGAVGRATAIGAGTGRAYDQVHRVGAEERTYHPGTDRTGGRFVGDVISATLGNDLQARTRLERHLDEERVERGVELRAAGTGAFAGVVVPQYLTDLYAPAARAMRPFADTCTHHDLPDKGMTVNISRITTPTSVALQAAEMDAVSETNIDDTLLSVPVQTYAGQQTLSRQAIDRGTGVEEIVVNDLMRGAASELDRILLNQATVGLSASSTAISYTDASPTVPELYPKFGQASAAIEATFLGLARPSHAVMSPRRWYWLQAQMTTAWPAFQQPNIPTQNIGVNNGVTYNQGVRGVLPNGLLVVTDANVVTNSGAGTNEDEVYIVAADECHLWEDPSAPVMIRAEEPKAANLGVLIVAFGYFAYTHQRFGTGAHQKITGTGLVTPTW